MLGSAQKHRCQWDWFFLWLEPEDRLPHSSGLRHVPDALRGPRRSPGGNDAGLIERAATDWLYSKLENRRSGAVAQNGLGLRLGLGLGLLAYKAVQSAWPNIPRRAAAAPQLWAVARG